VLILTSGLVSTSGTVVSALADFTSYSSQIAKVTPSSTFASSYVITNTVTPSCPTGPSFSASPTLPPVVNQNVCSCMISSLTCIAKPGLDSATALSAYQNICGTTAESCPGLHGNGSNGTYGAFSICTINERLSWALNMLYTSNFSECENDANAATQESSMTDGDCSEAMDEAGYYGTGTITTFPTATNSNNPIFTPTLYDVTTDDDLSHGAIAGITVGSIIVFAAIVAGSVWLCCRRGCCNRRRRSLRQSSATKNGKQPDSIHCDSPDQPSGLRGGQTSFISDDSRGMVELRPWDERYLGSRSNTEVQSSRFEGAGHGSVSEGSAYATHQRHYSSTSQHSGPELVSPIFPPSPMSSVKELPAFKAHDQPEDKSLGSMKFLSPAVKVSPVQAAAN
jgi:1,3-beta-glucanosyltransferase GAS1